MMIVFDSSTLVLLTKTEMLDMFLNDYKGMGVISRNVEKEATVKGTFDALLLKKRIEEDRIKIRNVKDDNVNKFMQDFNINIGEAESICLASGSKRSVLATDDKKAINACKLLGIPYTNALDILIRAREKMLLTDEQSEEKLNLLIKNGRYKKEMIRDAKIKLKEAGKNAKNSKY